MRLWTFLTKLANKFTLQLAVLWIVCLKSREDNFLGYFDLFSHLLRNKSIYNSLSFQICLQFA